MEKYTLITGASLGIGKAFAEHFASQKKNIILIARSEHKLLQLKQQLEQQFSISVPVLVYDLTIEHIAKQIYADVLQLNGVVDTLINCAGFGANGAVNELAYDIQQQQLMLNTVSLLDMTKLFLAPMVEQNEGTIINVASTSAYHPIPTMAAYAASKAFVLSFTEALAMECHDTNVQVFAISPGATDTNFFSDDGGVAYGRLRTPAHVVDVTMKALQQKRISKIDGFNNYVTSTLLPRILPRKTMAHLVYNIMKKE